MTDLPELSIVVAVKDANGNVPAILAALADLPSDCELLICVAGEAPLLPPSARSNTVLTSPSNALIPHLWRDGIFASRGRRVALTTAQCLPAAGWAARMRQGDIDRWAGIGGAIENDIAATPENWAIYFLRYSAFAPPLQSGEVNEIAADNAVYDRKAILAFPDLLAQGFWEPSFHRRFREEGRRLAIDPSIVVTHHGLVRPANFLHQRYEHGREYGLERGLRAGTLGSFLLLLRSPLLPLLIVVRIMRRVRARPSHWRHFRAALPWLSRFAMAWSLGEARGYGAALVTGSFHAHSHRN